MKIRLPPYVQAFRDRHGKPRYYFRKKGLKRVALFGLPWSPEFMAAHSAAMNRIETEKKLGAETARPGSINALAVVYLQSHQFQTLSDSTKATYRGIIDRIRLDHGDKPVCALERRHVERLVSERAKQPAAAHNFLRVLRILMKCAVLHNWRDTDPTFGVRSPLKKTSGFHSWTDHEIETFEAAYVIGSRERLAFDLLLHTAQRRSDVVRMGRQHIRNGILSIEQQKTGTRVEIMISAPLQKSIDALPKDQLTLLVTSGGKPFTPAGFTNWFREICDAVGLNHCSPHGLRKAAARIMAESNCTAREIMAVTGHKSLSEAERYTEASNQQKLAASAIQKVEFRKRSVKL